MLSQLSYSPNAIEKYKARGMENQSKTMSWKELRMSTGLSTSQ